MHTLSSKETAMFDNMPDNTFYFYVAVFWIQFILVVGYAAWWYLQPDAPKTRDEKKN